MTNIGRMLNVLALTEPGKSAKSLKLEGAQVGDRQMTGEKEERKERPPAKDQVQENTEANSEKAGVSEEIRLEEMSKKELIDKVESLQALAKKNFDLYVRAQADMDNLRKRFAKEKEDLAKYANETLVKQLLPVIDSLEKAIAHAEADHSLAALREGVELTLKALTDVLKRAGLEEIKASGEPFDPRFHEAVSVQENQQAEPGVVLEELQKGYVLNERLIRPSLVVVSKASAEEEGTSA